jgi:hypothetical protein
MSTQRNPEPYPVIAESADLDPEDLDPELIEEDIRISEQALREPGIPIREFLDQQARDLGHSIKPRRIAGPLRIQPLR